MRKRLKYRLKFKGYGWQVQARVWWIFWMDVGRCHSTYEAGAMAVRMANRGYENKSPGDP